VRLADVTQGRANNFQLLRFVAATGVIVFHCYALTNRFGDEPLMRLMPQLNFGLLGVETFFAISGFLVTKSWLERAKFAPFALARVLRIYPALTCAILVSIALAAWSSTVPLSPFLADAQTLAYAWKNALAWNTEFLLPGAFANNPYPYATNGSLWTLSVELRLYIAVAIAGAAGLLRQRWTATLAIALASALLFAVPECLGALGIPKMGGNLAWFFAIGSLAYVWRDSIRLTLLAALVCLLMIGWDPAGLARRALFGPLLAYLVLVAAYHPRLQWPSFNRWGDYSYGLYIFSFPIQQTLIRLGPAPQPIAPLALFAIAFPLTLAVAAVSWHVVEKPALAQKARFSPGRR